MEPSSCDSDDHPLITLLKTQKNEFVEPKLETTSNLCSNTKKKRRKPKLRRYRAPANVKPIIKAEFFTASKIELQDPSSELNDGDMSSTTVCDDKEEPYNKVCEYKGCGEKFKRSVNLERHIYQKHTHFKKYACMHPGCDKRYIILTHLRRHIKTSHEKQRETATKRISCTMPSCDRQFNTNTSLKRHIREYHDEKRVYKCPQCPFTCRHKSQFARHLVTHNPDRLKEVAAKIYDCTKCEMKFTKWTDLQNHRKKMHTPTCEVCGHTFRQIKNLKLHMQTHEKKAKNEKLTCPYEGCTRSYLHQRNLNTHVSVAHEGKRFQCPVEDCKIELTSRRRFDRHMRNHRQCPTYERKPQSERKDKGSKTTAHASILSGLKLPSRINRAIVAGKSEEIEVDCSSFFTTSDSEGEPTLAPKKFHIVLSEKLKLPIIKKEQLFI